MERASTKRMEVEPAADVHDAGRPRVACSLVIPAYNEASRIGPVLAAYAEALENTEILVVCNGCTDGTQEIVLGISMTFPCVRLLDYPVSLGKGGAILEGFRHASGDIVGFVDADESVSPVDFERMCAGLKEADAAIASRRVSGALILTRQPLLRRVASRAFNIFVRLVFGLNSSDTQCGAKVFRRPVLFAVLCDMSSTGFEVDVELLWRLSRAGYSVKEIPITWRHSPGSTFSLLHGPQMLWSLLRLRLWM